MASAGSAKLQQEIHLREQFIREREGTIEQQGQQLHALLHENQQLLEKCRELELKVVKVEGRNREAISECDEGLATLNEHLQEANKDLQRRLAQALLDVVELQQGSHQLTAQHTQLAANLLSDKEQLMREVGELKLKGVQVGLENVRLGGINAELNTELARLATQNHELESRADRYSEELR